MSSIVGNMDEVDQIVAAWRRERPDLDLAPLEVLSRVTRLAHRLGVIRHRVFAAHGLDGWEFDVLAALRRSGAPYELTPGRLAAETLVTSGTMTNRLDRLSARGLVERRPSPTDRRGVVVVLVEAGLTLVDATLTDLLAAEHRLVAALSGADQAEVAGHLRTLLREVGG